MRFYLPTLTLALITLLPTVCFSDAAVRVKQVEDGDTLLVVLNGADTRVQINGIDAPEDKENAKFKLDLTKTGFTAETLKDLGLTATAFLKRTLEDQSEIVLQGDLSVKDKYGRIPAKVLFKDQDIAELMVKQGFAVPLASEHIDNAYFKKLDRLERFSRKSLNGLWKSHSETMHQWYDRTR